MKKRIIIGAIAAVVLICFVAAIYMVNNKGASKKTEVMKVAETITDKVFLDGQVESRDTKIFYKDSTKGVIENMNVKDGDNVKSGSTLYRYKNESIVEKIDSLNSELESARRSRDSMKKSQSSMPGQPQVPVDTSQMDSQISSLQSQISSLNSKMYEEIKAPFDGRVSVNESAGEMGEPFVTVFSEESYMNASISEKDYDKIYAGDKVDVNFTATKLKTTGTIRFISENPTQTPVVDASTSLATGAASSSTLSNYKVEIDFNEDPGSSVKNGFHIQAVKLTKDDTVKVPVEAVIREDKKAYCFKVVNKKLVKQAVKTGQTKGNTITITSGIKIGDSIVKNPTKRMKAGDTIE